MVELNMTLQHLLEVNLLNIIPNNNSPKLCKRTFFQTKCCSITRQRSLMCEVILVALHAINMKLLNIIPNKNSPKLCKSTFFQTKCCSTVHSAGDI